MTIRTLVVDDEPLAREGVLFQLRDEADVAVVGECENGNQAIDAIRALAPDVVFLDIRMPKVSGFEVIERIGTEHMPLVIFLTAYDEHAIDAFRLNALDYLLKPIERTRFQASLHKVRKQLGHQRLLAQSAQLDRLLSALKEAASAEPQRAEPSRIALKLGTQITFVAPEELDWVEAEGDYVSVHTGTRSHLVRDTMQSMEARLVPYGFARIHRSTIVNLSKIGKLLAADNGDYEALLHSGKTLKIGRNYREALFARMKIES
jgi:two-component system LytT family response regulator